MSWLPMLEVDSYYSLLCNNWNHFVAACRKEDEGLPEVAIGSRTLHEIACEDQTDYSGIKISQEDLEEVLMWHLRTGRGG